MMDIQWAPLNIPLERRLQTLSCLCRIFFLTAEPLGVFLMYKLIYSSYWWVGLAYLAWIIYDVETCDRGSRPLEWVKNWPVWRYYCDYFPINLVKTAELDPSKNYLFGVYPHGYVSYGAFGVFATYGRNFKEMFPGLSVHMITLKGRFLIPFLRELFLSLGGCSASLESLLHLLDPRTQKGKCAALVVGGTAEILDLHPGQYTIHLKHRKGFIKVALRTGASLVPVMSFGEPDLFRPFNHPEGSLMRRFQKWFIKLTGLAPVMPTARGIFQYSFGALPFRVPINVVVGAPIPVKRTFEPTKEEVEELHALFTEKLVELFETEKAKYIKDHENVHLNIK